MKFYRGLWVVVVMLACSNVFAQDVKRKGFIIGGGLGGGALSQRFSAQGFSATESSKVLLTDFKIGYAPGNTLEIYYVSKGAWRRPEDIILLYGISALGVTKYLNAATATGLFVSGGVGLSALSTPFEDSEASRGFGVFAGAGFEFSPHWNVQADLLWGNITEFGVTLNSFGFRVTLNALSY